MQGNVFMGSLDKDGNILQMDRATNNNIIIGVDLETVADLKNELESQQEIIDNYYNKLVELGVIEVPKTAEQIASETAEKQLKLAEETALNQQKMINNQNSLLEKMMQKMELLEEKINKNGGEKHELLNENGDGIHNTDSVKSNKKGR